MGNPSKGKVIAETIAESVSQTANHYIVVS